MEKDQTTNETIEVTDVAEAARPSIADLLGAPKEDESKKEESKEEPAKEEAAKEAEASGGSESEPTEKERTVSLQALKEERRRRQAVQRELEALKQKFIEKGDEIPTTDVVDQPSPSVSRDDFALFSCNVWRNTKEDAQKYFDAFDAHLDEVSGDQAAAIWQRFVAAPDPGNFAYQFGKDVEFSKKYGTKPEEIVENVKKEVLGNKGISKAGISAMATSKKLPPVLKGASGSAADRESGYNKKEARELWG